MMPSPEHAALIAELQRARAFGESPTASPLWPRVPSELRRQFADGYINEQTFWDALERWLRNVA